MKKAILSLLVLLVASQSHAVSFQDYLKMKDSKDHQVQIALKLYIGGMAQGLMWANGFTKDRYNIWLYCQPMKLELQLDNYVAILNTELEKNKDRYLNMLKEFGTQGFDMLGFVLLKGLQDTFPYSDKR